ncbi:hypothetical protein [Virgibacillus proomii]|uniref:hypothetical protein n=1 Tax=Virgibacillus proomii TaxID=84407 RepID=UPI001C121F8A|nr:hypothetical protein [Virgibacillus proomii]MBU5267480.1 hypothetical protein [Virgibacillus proomii]
MKISEPNWLDYFHVIEKHLQKNEKWMQFPEKKAVAVEKDMNKWNESFLGNIRKIEDLIKELEKRMEE